MNFWWRNVLPADTWLGQRTVHRLGFLLSLAITGIMLILLWLAPGWLNRLENVSLDLRFKLRGERPVGNEIVLVVVDERSLREQGRWPWSRGKQARLVRSIAGDRPAVIGLDILYAEPEETEALRHLREIRQLAEKSGGAPSAFRENLDLRITQADTDRELAETIRDARNVVLAFAFFVPVTREDHAESGPPRPLPEYLHRSEFLLVREAGSGAALNPPSATAVAAPLEMFAREADGLGHVYGIPDPDGVTRYAYLALRYGVEPDYFPSLAVEMARLYLELAPEQMVLTLGVGLQLGKRVIPADQKARLLLDYAGREGTFPMVPATDVLSGNVPPGTFTGKAVLVGTAAVGTYDQKATPFSANFPGIEMNATVVENILHGRFLQKTVWAGPVDLAMTLFFGLAMGLALPRMAAVPGSILAVVALVSYGAAVQYAFAVQGTWLDVVVPTATLLLCFVAITVLKFRTEEKEKEQIHTLFSPYVGPQIVAELIRDPAKAWKGSRQRREVTLLFCDVVGFVKFCETHQVDEIVGQMNEYLGAMTEVVFHWGGTLIDFKGDEVYALWGAPLEQPDHVERAVKCAIHMRQRLVELNGKWEAEGKTQLQNGVGLNTGQVLFANMGAEGKRMKFEAVGDPVNLASRVEGLTRKFGAPIMMTEFTAARVKPLLSNDQSQDNRGRLAHVALRKVASVKVKGKEQPVVVYELRPLNRDEPSTVDEPVEIETLVMTDK